MALRNGIVGTTSAEEDSISPCAFSYLGIGHIFTCSNKLLRTFYQLFTYLGGIGDQELSH